MTWQQFKITTLSKMQETESLTSTSGYQLPPAEERADYIRRNFDAIARNYDRFNDVVTFGFHRLWKRSAIRLAALPGNSNRQVLDLCCGSGDLTLLFADRLAADSKVTALDFSPGMLQILQHRLNKKKYACAVELREGDAAHLTDCPNDFYDAVTIGFGLRNVQDRAGCLRECLRVLKPGRRLVILDVGRVNWTIPRVVHEFYFNRIVPRIGEWLHGERNEMYAYLPASARIYPGQQELARELEAAGFTEVRYANRFLGASVLHVAQKPV